MNRSILRIAAVTMALSGLTACGAIQDSQIFQPDFWSFSGTGGGQAANNTRAEVGLAELAKGNNVAAQGNFEAALKADPNDVYAIYGLAVMYQNTGQPARAAQLYEQILAIQPRPPEQIMVWADKQTQPVVDLAQVNLQMLQGGINPMAQNAMGQNAVGQNAMTQAPVQMQPMQPAGGGAFAQQPAFQPQAPMQSAAMEPMFKDADLNIVARFKTMRSLLDQGLITQEEFVQRRQTNVGALLPMTAARPPATGLDRPVPGVGQISGRLNAIGRALEMRALTPAQHTAERTMILDALMPAQPASVANPPPPPKGLMEAADAVRRLEMLKDVDLITSDEYLKERQAIEGSMQPAAAAPAPGMEPMAKLDGGGDNQPTLSGFQPAVHLASYRKQGAAELGWAQLTKRFSQLTGMQMKVERVDLGNAKGVFYRLKAGPLPSNAAAKDLCRQLKAKRQYCEPSTINFG